jgi:hypothetical protein
LGVSAPPPGRQRWLLPALVVVLSVTVGGGLLAREVYRQPDQAQPAGFVVLPSASASPSQEPGPGTVGLTPDAAAHPEGETIRGVLQAYFDAITDNDYAKWLGAVSDRRAQTKTREQLGRDYRSTHDGSVVVYRIESQGAGSLRVLVGFTSVQQPQDAPADAPFPCLHWRLVLPMVFESNVWKIDVAPSVPPEKDKC